MQPSKRHAPPSRLPASTTTVSRPSSAQRNAAEYPPGPPPSTATSTSVTRSPITMMIWLLTEYVSYTYSVAWSSNGIGTSENEIYDPTEWTSPMRHAHLKIGMRSSN